ncbi:putative ribonuclease H-like domain-containing protein [Tanacetum coccineum]
MLADSLLPTTFWAEAVNTACYVQNRVLVTKPHNKTPYELLLGRPPSISFMRPFGCPVTILNTLDLLGNFDGKADEGFLVGYSINSKAFRVFNTKTRKVEENLHINFLENKLNVTGSGLEWLFDIDSLIKSMNYEPEKASDNEYILLPLMLSNSPLSSSTYSTDDKDTDEVPDKGYNDKEGYDNNTNKDSTASPSISTVGPSINIASENINTSSLNINITGPIPNDSSMQSLENTGIFNGAYDDREVGAEADLNNLETTMNVSPIPTTRIHKDHPINQIIGDINSATQTRRMTKISEEHAMTLVDLPKGKRAIGTKWVYRNKKDERGIVVRNKARLVAQGYTQEERIDYDKVFALVAMIEVIRLFLAYASFMGLIVYQMDVKSAFLYGTIEKEVAWYETLSTYLLENRYRRGTIDKTLFIKKDRSDILLVQKGDGIFISQDKYVADILKKFDFVTVKTASTPMEPNKALVKDEEAEDVDVHLYRLMIGSLMYLTASRPDITFSVCTYARFQVTPKISHLYAVKRIFRRLNKVLWIQNQMLDYGFNFMNTKIHIDNESTICIVKNLVFHSKTKNIEIRHHFLRDSYEKKLIQVIKIHTDHNVADLLTKAFDVSRKARRTTEISQSSEHIHLVTNETVYKEWEDRMERATTTASSLEAEQDSGNINKMQSMATLNESLP